jgi:molybdopterin adenylyltransferase
VVVAVITVSDRAAAGIYEDRSGPALVEALRASAPGAEAWEISLDLVPDGIEALQAAFARRAGADWIITTGGTGPAPRDLSPEATLGYCDRELPGLADFLRLESLKETPFSVFSRGAAGMRGMQYIVNFPGSVKGAGFCARCLAPLMEHGLAMARGEGH